MYSLNRSLSAMTVRSAWLALCLTAGVGCGDDEGSPQNTTMDAGGNDGASAGDTGTASDAGSTLGAQYAVLSRIYGADFLEATSLLWLVDDLGAGTLDARNATELPGSATIWGVQGSGELYVVSAENLTFSKYRVQGSRAEVVAELGLTSSGITAIIGEQVVFTNDQRAFLIDTVSFQALELDLTGNMRIVRTIPLPQMQIAGADRTFLSSPGFRPHGSRLVASSYGANTNYDRVSPVSKLVFFDTNSATVEVVDAPCAGLGYSVAAPDGSQYFTTDSWVASLYIIKPGESSPPCMVRLPAGSDVPDAQTVALNSLTGAPTAGIIPGSNGLAYLRVLDMSMYKPSAMPSYNDAFSAQIWQTYSIQLGSNAAPVRIDRPLLAGGVRAFEVGGDAYENDSTANYATTTLVRSTGANVPARGVSMPGVTWGLVKVR